MPPSGSTTFLTPIHLPRDVFVVPISSLTYRITISLQVRLTGTESGRDSISTLRESHALLLDSVDKPVRCATKVHGRRPRRILCTGCMGWLWYHGVFQRVFLVGLCVERSECQPTHNSPGWCRKRIKLPLFEHMARLDQRSAEPHCVVFPDEHRVICCRLAYCCAAQQQLRYRDRIRYRRRGQRGCSLGCFSNPRNLRTIDCSEWPRNAQCNCSGHVYADGRIAHYDTLLPDDIAS